MRVTVNLHKYRKAPTVLVRAFLVAGVDDNTNQAAKTASFGLTFNNNTSS
jgi:hypothetical protein